MSPWTQTLILIGLLIVVMLPDWHKSNRKDRSK